MPPWLQWISALGLGAILGTLIAHILTTLSREAEREYERVSSGYEKMLEMARNILESNLPTAGAGGVEGLAKEIDRAWLYASDEVIRILNQITDRARASGTSENDRLLLGRLVAAMRRDLWWKAGLVYKFRPWRHTSLQANDYRLISPGPAARR